MKPVAPVSAISGFCATLRYFRAVSLIQAASGAPSLGRARRHSQPQVHIDNLARASPEAWAGSGLLFGAFLPIGVVLHVLRSLVVLRHQFRRPELEAHRV